MDKMRKFEPKKMHEYLTPGQLMDGYFEYLGDYIIEYFKELAEEGVWGLNIQEKIRELSELIKLQSAHFDLVKPTTTDIATINRLNLENVLEIVEAAKTNRPNCQNCTWCLRDDEDTKWMCMYPYDDFGFESSKCPKDKWFGEQFGR